MAGGWMILALTAPPAITIAAGLAGRDREPEPVLTIALNALMPGAGLAFAGRPLVEVVAGVILSCGALLAIGGPGSMPAWILVAIIGAVWAKVHTQSSTVIDRSTAPAAPSRSFTPSPSPGPSAAAARPVTSTTTAAHRQPAPPAPPQADEEAGYTVTVPCTECGAVVETPVMHHMAHCPYCGSNHLLVGQDETLHLAIPERCSDETSLLDAVLDHYRYQHYLKLYRRQVAPLAGAATEASPGGHLVTRPEVEAAATAAEAAVSRQADAYRDRLAGQLRLGNRLHLLAPYRHGMGTLYQAAFGRCKRTQNKQLRFALATIEASALASNAVDLPAMGKLSYLRALLPAAHYGDQVKVLALETAEQDLQTAYGELDRKQLVRDINVIRLGVAFTQHVGAVVWRPYWVTEVSGGGFNETLLVDSATGSVVDTAPYINPEVLTALPEEATAPGRGLRFLPMQCPTCGHEFTFEPDAVLHYCRNCHRVCGVHSGQKHDVEYSYAPLPEQPGFDLVPFWFFPLRLRTADGTLLTDLLHLKDGIDGTLDQIGDDAQMQQHAILVPAIRCISSKLMAEAFNRLFLYVLRAGLQLRHDRFPLDIEPTPWEVGLEEEEARRFAPLYLANAFGPRDIARVNVNQVASWLFQARLESQGRLAYVPIPQQITNPFRDYTGRSGAAALDRAASTRG